ncbi:MAG: alpha-ketoacid dehydrogenase subunit beta [Armatimonadetes bacterium]|nr:alpha-ketoacid dehydrogenase subunit beta [Armatimonadota bacterium]
MSQQLTNLESLRSALQSAMADDETVVVFGEDILDPYGGAFKVTKGLSTAFPNRVFTTPICEGAIVGMANGLALRGMRPVAELMFGDFITLAADQLINHAAKFPAMYNGRVTLPLVVRTPMGGGRGYGPTHSQSLERMFCGVPHLSVVAPTIFHDAGKLLRAAIASDGPVVFIENKLLYPLRQQLHSTATIQHDVLDPEAEYPTVRLRNFGAGDSADVTLIANGGVSRFLPSLLERLADEEIRLQAVLPSVLSPLPPIAPLAAAAADSGRVVIAEEGIATNGWGAELAARLYESCMGRLACPIVRIGAMPTVIPAAKHLEDEILPSETTILNAILKVLS